MRAATASLSGSASSAPSRRSRPDRKPKTSPPSTTETSRTWARKPTRRARASVVAARPPSSAASLSPTATATPRGSQIRGSRRRDSGGRGGMAAARRAARPRPGRRGDRSASDPGDCHVTVTAGARGHVRRPAEVWKSFDPGGAPQPSRQLDRPEQLDLVLELDAELLARTAARLLHEGERIGGAGPAGVLDKFRVPRRVLRPADPVPLQATGLEHPPRRQLVLGVLEYAAEGAFVRRLRRLPQRLELGDRRLDLVGRARREPELGAGAPPPSSATSRFEPRPTVATGRLRSRAHASASSSSASVSGRAKARAGPPVPRVV